MFRRSVSNSSESADTTISGASVRGSSSSETKTCSFRRFSRKRAFVLKAYASYYNQVRTHLSLDKEAPDFRGARPVGNITALLVLGG